LTNRATFISTAAADLGFDLVERGDALEGFTGICHLFLFIGAGPNTSWLSGSGVALDANGFVLTGADVSVNRRFLSLRVGFTPSRHPSSGPEAGAYPHSAGATRRSSPDASVGHRLLLRREAIAFHNFAIVGVDERYGTPILMQAARYRRRARKLALPRREDYPNA
jgi:hypothetical protein